MYRLFFFIFFLSFSPFLVHAQSPDNLPPPATDEDLSSAIVFHLSEIMSCPFTGEPEWIEIYNDSDFDWEMVGWKIRNKNNVTRNIASHLITASSLVVIEFSSGVLGNSGDTFSLENNLGEVFFTVTIPACSANGTSFVFNGSSWVETPTPTPAAPNSSPSSSPNNTSPTAGDPHSTP
ncbi:lamin tail domain-containing protein, partial [Microgenomates group bacterium]|nr:lamin tail domain-containing protein [Microgenomates group bacterium]